MDYLINTKCNYLIMTKLIFRNKRIVASQKLFEKSSE